MTEQFTPVTSPSSEQQVQKAATPWYDYVMPVALGAFYLLFLWLDFSYMNMTRWPWAPILSFGLLAPAGWGLLQLRHLSKPYRGLGNGLDWAALLWVIALVASTLFSHVPHRSHWYLVMALSYIAALYALSHWLDSRKKVENLAIFLVGSTFFFSCNSLYLFIFRKWLPTRGKPFAVETMVNNLPLGHQNFVAGFLVLTLPVAVGVALYYKDWRRWLGITTSLVGSVVMLTTGSRGGLLGLGAALVLGLTVTLLIDWTWKKVRGALAALSAFLLFIIVVWNTNEVFRAKITTSLSGQDVSILSRSWAGEVGFNEWKANPLFGVGIGANPYTFEQYNTTRFPWSQPVFQQLHNSWIQVLAEIGSLGGIAILVTLALLIGLVWKLYRSGRLTVLSIAIFCGLAGYGLMSITDYQLEIPAISMALVILGALVVGYSQDLPDSSLWSENIRQGIGLAGLSLVATPIVFLIPVHRALYESQQGFTAYSKRSIPLFYNHLVNAISLNSNDPYYPLQLSIVMQMEGLKEKDSAKRFDFNKRGAFWAEVAVKKMPILHTYENAGWAFVNLHKYDVAESFFQKASDIDPTTKSTANLGLGISSLQQISKKDKGIDALANYLFMHPEYFMDVLWEHKNSILMQNFLPITNQLLAVYDRVLSQYPQDVDLLYGKAMVYYVQGNNGRALSVLKSINFNANGIAVDKNISVLPRNLTPNLLENTERCLRTKESKHKKLTSVYPIDLINYDGTDYFLFRHMEGVKLQVIWPFASDYRRFNCTPLGLSSSRFVSPNSVGQAN